MLPAEERTSDQLGSAREQRIPKRHQRIDFDAIKREVAKRTGTIDGARVHVVKRRIPPSVIEAYRGIDPIGPTGIVADALDELGVVGCVPASILSPTIPGAVVIGTALTLRRIPSRSAASNAASARASRMAAFEVHYQAKQGDVLVIDDSGAGSSGGGDSALLGVHYGEVGAVVDGAIREVAQTRRAGFPMWVREITPMSGKWRNDAVEINGPVNLAGVQVQPGDLVIADDSGVCVVPAHLAMKALRLCLQHARSSPGRTALKRLRADIESRVGRSSAVPTANNQVSASARPSLPATRRARNRGNARGQDR